MSGGIRGLIGGGAAEAGGRSGSITSLNRNKAPLGEVLFEKLILLKLLRNSGVYTIRYSSPAS